LTRHDGQARGDLFVPIDSSIEEKQGIGHESSCQRQRQETVLRNATESWSE
jgi:hypothetical protein